MAYHSASTIAEAIPGTVVPITSGRRAVRAVEPDDRARSAALFIGSYIAVVLLFVGAVSQAIGTIAG